MKYLYSQLDRDNLKWFSEDMTVASLTEITLSEGQVRGLSPFKIEIEYPISVIAGRNRSGKSTILAMAACAYHNKKDGFKLPERKYPYYTFSDFFVQTASEVPIEGIEIEYRFMYNNWRKGKEAPNGEGNLPQIRTKSKGGKWNKYSNRVYRTVVFFGVQRVVPPSEKSVSKVYRTYFSDQNSLGWENQVKEIVGRILSTNYDLYNVKVYTKYHLPVVTSKNVLYSGFNMGAGENAFFEIFSTIFATPKGTLIIIDEIELGLHEDAQKKLIQELKNVCKERRIQVLCTTHSSTIIGSLPPEARFYIQRNSEDTAILNGISSLHAAGMLSGENSKELDVFVEDVNAQYIVESLIDADTRKRIMVVPIGSSQAIIHQMAAKYKGNKPNESIAILDGDQANKIANITSRFVKAIESSNNISSAKEWFTKRLAFLPGDTWPEVWLINAALSCDLSQLSAILKTTNVELAQYLEVAKVAGKHKEFYNLAQDLGLEPNDVLHIVTRIVVKEKTQDFSQIVATISQLLS
jgi:AAA15 family ATPase/GTPase